MTPQQIQIQRKPTVLLAMRCKGWGVMWTPRGFRTYSRGDYIVSAPTGCKWPMKQKHLHEHYEVLR